MKHLQPFFNVVAFLAIAVLIGIAAAPDNAPPAGYEIYRTSATDTITNTGADTITISPNLLSYWKYNYTVKADQLTGTVDFDVTVQESNTTSGNEWYTIATDSIATDGGTVQLTGNVAGLRHRVIITGVGTQSSIYQYRCTLKKEY